MNYAGLLYTSERSVIIQLISTVSQLKAIMLWSYLAIKSKTYHFFTVKISTLNLKVEIFDFKKVGF